MSTKTRVYITVDVEAAEERVVGGRALPPQGYDLRVWCRFRNQRRELGIDLLMRELEACGLVGTFFVEALGAAFFGLEKLRDVCRAIRARGHDVQLHTHPIQRNAAFRSRNDAPVSDDMGEYDLAEQIALLREGIDILAACDVPRREIVGYRAGNFAASNDTWRATREAGLVVSSNYNPCYFDKGCKMRHDGARQGLFQPIDGVWELPVSNFEEEGGAPRHVQITAVSSDEMIDYLVKARAAGIGEACIVTHSFELCHIDSVIDRTGRVNSVNLRRFRSLCRFLKSRASELEVDTVGALGRRLRAGEERVDPTSQAIAMPHGQRRLKAKRLLEQAYKRIEAKIPISMPA
jgi:hypothetical protein